MLNQTVIEGRIMRPPELRHTRDGVPICTITVEVERDQKSKDGKSLYDHIDCVLWRDQARFVAQTYKSDDLIALFGQLRTTGRTNKQGFYYKTTELKVELILMAGEIKSLDQVVCASRVEFYEIEDGGELPF